MNERIRLLAEQAFFDDATGQPSDRMYTLSDHKMQQFAELIVQETLNVALYGDEHAQARDNVKTLFGVER